VGEQQRLLFIWHGPSRSVFLEKLEWLPYPRGEQSSPISIM